MKRIIFILSLILMVGIQAKAQKGPVFEGSCIDVVRQDPTQGLFYNFPISHVLPIYCAFVTPTIVNGYTQSMTISDGEIEMLYFKNKQKGYYDLPIQVENNGSVVNCYIRIQFI